MEKHENPLVGGKEAEKAREKYDYNSVEKWSLFVCFSPYSQLIIHSTCFHNPNLWLCLRFPFSVSSFTHSSQLATKYNLDMIIL